MTIDISVKKLDVEGLNNFLILAGDSIETMEVGKETLNYFKKTVFTNYKGKDVDIRYNNIPVKVNEELAFGKIVLNEITK